LTCFSESLQEEVRERMSLGETDEVEQSILNYQKKKLDYCLKSDQESLDSEENLNFKSIEIKKEN